MPSSNKKSDPNPWEQREQREQGASAWSIVLVGLMGATATTVAYVRLRRTFDWFYSQLNRSQSSWRSATGSSYHGGGGFREDVRNRYTRRMQEEYEDEMERVERIRRMQSVFNRERSKQKQSYESWRQNDPGPYQSQHFQRDDWYWKTDTSYKDQRTNFRSTPRDSGNYKLSHHYSVLGLSRSRANPYSEAEIKRLRKQNLRR